MPRADARDISRCSSAGQSCCSTGCRATKGGRRQSSDNLSVSQAVNRLRRVSPRRPNDGGGGGRTPDRRFGPSGRPLKRCHGALRTCTRRLRACPCSRWPSTCRSSSKPSSLACNLQFPTNTAGPATGGAAPLPRATGRDRQLLGGREAASAPGLPGLGPDALNLQEPSASSLGAALTAEASAPRSSMRSARYSESRATPESRPEPHVWSHGSPRK